MLSNERPTECGYCWRMEDLGHISDRHYRSGEPWAREHLEKIVTGPWDQDVMPSYVEVNFNSACNLRCSYCSPQYSSSWMDESVRHGAYPTSTPHNDPGYFQGRRRPIPNREHNPYLEAFWRWWPDLYPHLRHFRMTGGEPMMDRNTYRVFDYVLENPRSDLHLNVTSNFSVEQSLWQKYLDYVQRITDSGSVEHFMQFVSLDCVGSRAEYIRDGLDFALLWDRVNQYLQTIKQRSSITFIVTVNNLSLTTMRALMNNILWLRRQYNQDRQLIWFDTPVLTDPAWQSIQILPEEYRSFLEETKQFMIDNPETEITRFRGFKDYEIDKIDRLLSVMRQPCQDLDRHQADFWRFFAEHDRRRGTDLRRVFFEMSKWFDHCERLANGTGS